MNVLRLALCFFLLLAGPSFAQVVGGGGSGGGGGGGVITDIQDGAGDTVMNAALDAVNMVCVSGCGGSGGSSQADDAAFSVGVNDVNPAGFMFDDVSPDAVNEGDAGIARMSANRVQYQMIRDGEAGAERGAGVNASNELKVVLSAVPSHAVTNAGTFAVQAAQAGTWNIGTVTAVTGITNALPAGDNNIGNVDIVTVPADPFGANADAGSATGSISAKLRFIAATGIPITGTVTVGSHAVTNAGTFATQPAGSVAHDAAAAAVNPVLTGCYGSAAAPSDVSATNDAVREWCLLNGARASTITQGGLFATVRDTGSSDSLNVAIVDASGNHITSFGGGTQYTEGDTDATITGTVAMWEDTSNTLVATSAAKPLPVHIISTAVGSLAETEDGSVNGGSSSVTAVIGFGYVYDTGGAAWGRAASGNGTVNGNTPRVTIASDSQGTSIATQATAANLNAAVVGNIAHDSADSGNPVKVGGKAYSSPPSVTANDRVDAYFDTAGRLHMVCDTGCGGSGGTAQADKSTFTEGTTTATPIMGVYNQSLGADPSEDQAAAIRSTIKRALHTSPYTPAGDSMSDETNDAIRVNIVAGAGAGGTSIDDDSAFTAGTTAVTPIAGVFDDASVDSVDEDNAGAIRMSGNRNMYAQIRDAAGNERGLNITAGGALNAVVTNAGTFATQAAQSGTWNVTNVSGTVSLPTGAATEATLAGVLTSANFAAAFGTAGSADTQVMSIQGIASMTPVQVQSNSANIATETTAGSILTAVQLIDNAISGAGFNITQLGGVNVTMGNGASGTGVQRVTIADNSTGILGVNGTVAHDSADAGAPVKIGGKAVAFGANPTAVTAADRTDLYANRHGIPFVLGGHMNSITKTALVTDADGQQTNAALVTVAAGLKVGVTRVSAKCDADNTVSVRVKVGFATATLPADSAGGAVGVLAEHPDIPAGGGFVEGDGAGILGIGADDEDVRFTMDDPVTGSCSLSVTYFTIES